MKNWKDKGRLTRWWTEQEWKGIWLRSQVEKSVEFVIVIFVAASAIVVLVLVVVVRSSFFVFCYSLFFVGVHINHFLLACPECLLYISWRFVYATHCRGSRGREGDEVRDVDADVKVDGSCA